MDITSWLRNLILPLNDINESMPLSGLIYEIGSGYGTLSFELARYSSKRRVIGIDTDEQKINKAKKLFSTPNLTFIQSDANTLNFQKCVGVVMSDFLHHISYMQQQKLLTRLSKKIRKSEVLVIKEIDRADGWRKLMSRMWDLLFYPKDTICYLEIKELVEILEKLGFSVKVKRKIIWFPGSTYLFICQKL